jgi:hypothetical protein
MTNGEKIVVGVLVVAAVWVGADYLILQGLIPSIGGLGGGTDDPTNGDSPQATGVAAAILGAIQSAENVAGIHNNPGGICGSYNADGTCAGPATYPTLAAGTQAAEALITKYLVTEPSITVAQFVQKWTGGATSGYLQRIETILHLGPNDPISDAGNGSSAASGGSESDSDDEDNPEGGDDDGGGDDDE